MTDTPAAYQTAIDQLRAERDAAQARAKAADKKRDTTSDAENDFRGQLEAVWPYAEWRVVHLWQDRWMVATSRHVAVKYKEDRKARTVAYAVEIGDRTERAPTLKEAVAAFAPVECEVDP